MIGRRVRASAPVVVGRTILLGEGANFIARHFPGRTIFIGVKTLST